MATIDSLQNDGAPQARPTGGSGLGWAWISSGALIAAAATLAVVPRAVPSLAHVASDLARSGLTWPLVGGFGLVLAAVAASARRPREEASPSAPVTPDRSGSTPLADDPLARDIASDLARVRGGLHDLRIEFVYVKDALARLQQSATSTATDPDRDAEAAIFRLAASLDQLSGRIEHELAGQRAWLSDVLENQLQRASADATPLPRFADPYLQGFEGSDHEIDLCEGYVASEDDMAVEVSLEEDVGWVAGLGVLDEIHEPRGPLAHAKTSPSHRPSSADTLLGELEQAGSARAQLDEKMARLRDLLSDPAVQRALESQTRY